MEESTANMYDSMARLTMINNLNQVFTRKAQGCPLWTCGVKLTIHSLNIDFHIAHAQQNKSVK